jgi:hypothetical protein
MVDTIFHSWEESEDRGPGLAVMTTIENLAPTRTAVCHDYLYPTDGEEGVGLEVREITVHERELLRARLQRHEIKFGNVAQERLCALLA